MSEQPAPPPNPTPPRRRDHQRISSIQIVFAAILSIGLLLVINFSGRIARNQQMARERDRLQATLDALQEEQIALRQERDYTMSDAYIEDWAHTEGKRVREGEILVIPIPDASIGTPVPTVPPAQPISTSPRETERSEWELWWDLFFDGDPPF